MKTTLLLPVLALLVPLAPTNAHADSIPPPTPTFISVSPYACHRVEIKWRSSYDVGSGLDHYNLYQRPLGSTSQLKGEIQGEVAPKLPGERHQIWYLEGTNFDVGLQAVDRAGLSSPIAWYGPVAMPELTSPKCQDTWRPSPPTGLGAVISAGTCAEVSLVWNNDGVDYPYMATGVKGYNIYRDMELLYFRSPLGTMQQQDRFGLIPGQAYTYSVYTVDNAGLESASAANISITIPDCRHRTPAGDRSIDVVGVRFPDQALTPPNTMAQIDGKLFANLGTSARTFFTETSYGRATFHRQTLNGYYTLPYPTSHYCLTILSTGEGTNCNDTAITQDTKAALTASGVAQTGDLMMIVAVGAVESKTGVDNVIRLNGNKPLDLFLQTAVHELSHSFGVAHSADWHCPGYFSAGPDITDLQFGCDGLLYGGDGYSPLGYGKLKHHPAFTKRLMGFLTALQTKAVTVDGNYTIGRLEEGKGSRLERVAVAIKELTLGTSEGYTSDFSKGPLYSVEYRTTVGYDGLRDSGGDPPFDGLLVHLVPDRLHGPDANTFLVAKLLPASGANIFYDPVNELGVKLTSADGIDAVVTVCGIHGTICPPEFAASIPPWP